MKISIIIPTYNYEQYISETILSVIAQPIRDIEIIVIDDGSTDDTKKQLKPYWSKIKYVYQENAGLSAARNRGILESTGEFINFLDADDILGENVLFKQRNFLKKNPDTGIAVCRNRTFSKINKDGKPRLNGIWRLFRNSLDIHLCHVNIAPPHAFMYRREAIKKTGFFDTRLKASEDHDYLIRAVLKGFIPKYNPDGIVYYRRHPQSMSSNIANQRHYDAIVRKKLLKSIIESPGFPNSSREETLLAFFAGNLFIAEGIYKYEPDESDRLLDQVLLLIPGIHILRTKKLINWNNISILYFFTSLALLKSKNIRNSDKAKKITELLLNIPQNTKRHIIFMEIVNKIIFGSRHQYLERLAISKATIIFFTRTILQFYASCRAIH